MRNMKNDPNYTVRTVSLCAHYQQDNGTTYYSMQNIAYRGTDLIPFSNPKFFCEMRIA